MPMVVSPTWALDLTNFRMSFARALILQREEVQKALWDAKSALSALSALADGVDLWAADIERILLEALADNAPETRNTRRAYPY